MTERIIALETDDLTSLLGVQHSHVRLVAKAYPKAKIVARGNQLVLKGEEKEVEDLQEVFRKIIDHHARYGKLTTEQVASYLASDDESAMARVEDSEVILHSARGEVIKAKTANQKRMVQAGKTNDIVFAIGPAGTGKTYTAVALAVKALKDKKVKKLIITRPAVEAGENLGFLPGDLKEKIDPYLRPIYDALDDMIHAEKLKNYIEKNTIEIAPLAYMRGRTLNNAFILLDEAQNTTPMQLKMFLTRMGPESKMMITGDISQIDLPKSQKSGLIDAYQKLKNIDGISFIELDGRDVVRHPLVVKILDAYEKSAD